jgi:hypothetical protein
MHFLLFEVTLCLLYVFFWVIPHRLNSDAGELPRIKHTTYRTRQKFEIENTLCFYYTCFISSWNQTGIFCWN